MLYRRVAIAGIAHRLPEVTIRTAFLEKRLASMYARLHIPQGTLESMTGVSERRIWREGFSVAEASALSAEDLFLQTGFDRSQVDALFCCSVSRDHLEPSTASLVHAALNLSSDCRNCDLGNACLGFLSSIEWAASAIEAGHLRSVLICAGESSRAVTSATLNRLLQPDATFDDYRNNLATLTLGSASVAMLLCQPELTTSSHRLLSSIACAETSQAKLCLGSNEGMVTDAPKLLQEGVALASRTFEKAKRENGVDPSRIAEFALHQVGKANHQAVLKALSIPEEHATRLYPTLGNVGAAGVPLTLSYLAQNDRLKAGDRVLLMGIGSGLNVSMQEVCW